MGTQEKLPESNNSMQRVKVYRLNDDGKWDDQGTGHVTVDYLERSEDMGLFVIDEEDNETLLLHRISSDDIYRKQEDTIISWRDPEFSTELALSFQETTGCSYIWDHICSVQRNMHFSSLTNDTINNVNSELRELPSVELSTLPLILKTIVDSSIADQLRVNELILNDQEFFRKLMELFRICEDLENIDGLHLIFKIIRAIILLNNSQILEKFFGDEFIMDTIGCLEYDPEAPRAHYRNFLKENVVFKEAIPIKDPAVLSKIHQTYRVGYIKDVILLKVLDDAVVASLNAIIHSNNATVISSLKDDNAFIKDLFERLKSPNTTKESKKNLVHFLQEFCTLGKSLQMAQYARLYRDLVSEGVYDIIADTLQSEDKKLILTGTDILILFINQDPSTIRSHVTQQESVLFGLLVKNMLTDFGDDMHCQFLEILRTLLDSYTPGPQRDAIVEIFYEKHLGQVIDVITSSCQSGNERHDIKPEILMNACDLLCFCVLHHPYRIKCSFLLNNTVDKVLCLTKRREKFLVIAAIRFVRTLISRHDEHLMNHFVKNNLLKPVVDAFVANGDRYNLLNSAVLELFEYIRKENLKILLKYLVDTFWDQLAKFEHISSIQALKVKYEQSLESAGTKSSGNLSDQRKRTDERGLEKEEEEYFNEDSDEEDSASARKAGTDQGQSQPPVVANGSAPRKPSPRSGGLVDYADDEDDEDYKPPPKKVTDSSNENDDMADFQLKRKLVSKDEPEPKRLRASSKTLKPKEGVFSALRSTLSQSVLPTKKAASTIAFNIPQNMDQNKKTMEPNHEEKVPIISQNETENTEKEDHADNLPLLPPKSSPEMAVNGS